MVICVLDHLVDGIFEVADDRVIVADDVTVGLDLLLDETLAHTQVLDHEAETGVHRVVLLQLLVHRSSAVSQVNDLELLGGNVLPQVSDLLIEHKLELFQLLRLLLEMQDVLFSLVDDVVLDVNLGLFLRPLLVELLLVFLLLVKLD